MRRLMLTVTAMAIVAAIMAASAMPAFAANPFNGLTFGGCQSFTAQTGLDIFSGEPSTPSEQAAEFNPRPSHGFVHRCG